MSSKLLTAGKVAEIRYLPTQEELNNQSPIAGKALIPGHNISFPIAAKERGTDSEGRPRYEYQLGLDDIKNEEIKLAVESIAEALGVEKIDKYSKAWSKYRIELKQKTNLLNLDGSNIDHLIIYYAIKGGGIPSIAASYDTAVNAPTPPRWYMISPEEQIKIDIAPEKAKNKAIYILEGLFEKGKTDDLFLLHKALIASDRGITKETPRDTLYSDLNKFINGEFVKTDRRRTPVDFVEWAEVLKKDKNFVVAYAHLKDGLYYNILFEKEMSIFNRQTNGKYPGDLKKAAEHLMSPTNIDEFTNLKSQIKFKWLEIE
jgi:hypothetical protein